MIIDTGTNKIPKAGPALKLSVPELITIFANKTKDPQPIIIEVTINKNFLN
jgi:hypothetical protein